MASRYDDEDDRPRRKRRREDDDDDDFDDRPRRKRPRKRPQSNKTLKTVAIVGGILGGILVLGCCALSPYAVSNVRVAAGRSQTTNNMKEIGLGVHNYAGTFAAFPNAATKGIAGFGGNANSPVSSRDFSWRASILPYIEQAPLYSRLKLDEPWNSPANLPLSSTTVRTFAPPSDTTSNTTYLRMFVGKDAIFDPSKGHTQKIRLQEIFDGTSNTIWAVESGEAVPWAQYNELPFDKNGVLPRLGQVPGKPFVVLMCDGSVRAVNANVNPDVLKKAITPRGGEVFSIDELD